MLSFLILKAFDECAADSTQERSPPKTNIDNDSQVLQTPIDSRMKALNYLGSLLSQQFVQVDSKTWLKCIELVTQRYTQNQKAYAQGNHSQHDQLTSNHRIFNHCFYINLALIFACRNQELKVHREDLHAKISKILFLKKWPSLKYASPFILEALLESTRLTDGLGEKLESGHDNRQM